MLNPCRAAVLALCLLAATTSASKCQIDAARAYVTAIVSHSKEDAAAVPLEDSVVRFEGPPGLSLQSANGAEDLRKSLQFGPSSFTVYKAGDEEYRQINSTAVQVVYTINVGLLGGVLPLTKAKVDEYFAFNKPAECDIQRIDATFYIGQTN